MYGKFFVSAFTGSLFGKSATVFATLVYIVANMKPTSRAKDAPCQVEVNPTLLAATFATTVDEIDEALRVLESPDPCSRSKDDDGRRIILLDAVRHSGPMLYRVVNGAHYRSLRDEEDRRAYLTEAKRKERAKPATVDSQQVSTGVNNVNPSRSRSRSKETLRVPRRDCDDAFVRCLKLVPIPKGQRGARKTFDSDVKQLEHDAVDAAGLAASFAAYVCDLETGITHYAEECRRENTERRFVKQAASLFADFRDYLAEPTTPARLQLVVPMGGGVAQ